MNEFANPRLIDVFGSDITQDDVSFAIPKLNEDIPLYFDPFLLWKSEKSEYHALHEQLLIFFQLICFRVRRGKISEAAELLAGCEEPRAMGLGYASGSKLGSNIGPKLISGIIKVCQTVPQLRSGNIKHVEEIQLVVPGIAEDRISDTASSIVKRFFIEFTATQAKKIGIPTRAFKLGNVFNFSTHCWMPAQSSNLPYNPKDNAPILFVPLDVLRHLPWINYQDYYRTSFAPHVLPPDQRRKRVAKAAVLEYNARNYVEIERYVETKEKTASQCHPDPLFKPLSSSTLQNKVKSILELNTGSAGGADRKYEDLMTDLFSSLFYPTLEFAENRVRTVSGAHIRDLIFYNDGKNTFWEDLRDRYEAKQPVFELKNVKSLETEHVNQLYRYLDEEFGRLGVLVTRNPTPKAIQRNIIDLHSSKRVVILCVNDRDLELMLSLLDSGRDPTEAIKKKYIEFSRLLPK